MQVKDQTVIRRNKYSLLVTILKGAVTLTCLYFLWDRFAEEELDFAKKSFTAKFFWTIAAVTLLMIINWYLESLRWKLSLNSFENISIHEAWSAVLAGLALNWVLPFTGGDFAARLMKRQDKYQTTSAIILNRSVMLLITLGFGVFSMQYLKQSFFQISYLYLFVTIASLLVLYFFRKRLTKFLNYFKAMNRRELIQILSISVLRYGIFTFQFYWLIAVFNPELDSLLLFAGIGWIFFVRSIIPHLLGGIGLREAAGVVFFTPHVSEITSILIPVFLIWLINTVVPSIVGLVFIWKTKWSGFLVN